MLEFRDNTEKPRKGQVIIAKRKDGNRGQVLFHKDKLYLWRYDNGLEFTKDPEKFFCDWEDIEEWRGCSGMDF